jgi:hypothetical protein
LRLTAIGVVLSLVGPLLAGCGRDTSGYDQGPVEATRGSRSEYPAPAGERQGMSTGQKVAVLAGAAALYYLYRQHQNKQGAGQQGQYYLSKNGRVYYRDKNGDPVWVTPPREGIRVPAEEAEQYSRFRGYNGQSSGETFGGYGAGLEPVAGSPPGPGY